MKKVNCSKTIFTRRMRGKRTTKTLNNSKVTIYWTWMMS
jgi:hypothetical protein